MTAKIKHTGETLKVEGVYLEDGYDYGLDEIEVIPESNPVQSSIDWEQRRFELVKAAMQGLLSSWTVGKPTPEVLIQLTFQYADAVLTEYRKGGKE